MVFSVCYIIVGVRVSFSHAEYRVKESDGHVIIKVIVSGYRKFPIQLVARSFIPTKYNLPAGWFNVIVDVYFVSTILYYSQW